MKLPKKLSDGILLALADLRWVERSKKYTVDMGSWHQPQFSGNGVFDEDAELKVESCVVCLAGSVMAHTLKVAVDEHAEPDDFAEGEKLRALDAARMGHVEDAINYWYDYENPIADLDLEEILNKAVRAELKGVDIEFRAGDYLYSDQITVAELVPNGSIPDYHDDRDGFFKAMKKLAKSLAALGY